MLRPLLIALVVLVVAIAASVAVVSHRLSASPFKGPPSDHFDGRTFNNLEPFPDKSLVDVLRWKLTSTTSPWASWIDEAPGPRPVARVTDGSIRVTWINHASVLVQLDGINIITDPIYSDRASPFSWIGPRRHRGPGIAFDELPPIDLVVVSHNHYDHMDVPTLQRLQARDGAPVLVGLGNTAYLAARGVTGTRDMDWWDEIPVGAVRVTAAPSQHWSARFRGDRRRTLWAAYMIEGPSGRVYFGGDTGYGRHFALTKERLGAPDIALLPIGAFMPVWFMRPAHMSPGEAVQASRDLGAAMTMPMHYGTWQLGDDGDAEPEAELREALASDGAQQQVWRVARHGHVEILTSSRVGAR
ncbi:MAG: MBL fold metallo-hydrolase [Cytophagaceae bacterium]|nr:MBL fold metallo-hydrolase [Gemmatimonadaceae bacterium]